MPLMTIYTFVLASWCFASGLVTAIITGRNWIEKDRVSSVPFVLGVLSFAFGFIFLVLASVKL